VAPEEPFQSDPEFIWDLHEFPEPKLTDDIDFDWKDENAERPEEKLITENPEDEWTTENPEEEFITEHPEEELIAENPEEELIAENPEEELMVESSEEELIPEPEIELFLESGQSSAIDKFYTFDKKNEEFQKLLDKEYEKVKGGETSEEEEIPETEAFTAKEAFPPEEAFPEEEEIPGEATAPEAGAAPEEENIIFDNATIVKKFDTKEFNKDLIESALERAGVADFDYEISDGVEEKDIYESGFKPRFIEDSYDDIDVSDPQKQEAFKALEELWDSYEQEKSAAGIEAEKEKKPKRKAGRIILLVLAILVAIEVTFIGIKIHAPDSLAAAFITENLGFTVTWLTDFRLAPEPVNNSE